MILISHRGNINSRNEIYENHPSYINEALSEGYNVEVDIWYDGEFFLGHDYAKYKTDLDFLRNPLLWCHAKNIDALYEMLKYDIHCFFHKKDDCVLTSKGYIWTYPGYKLTEKSIFVLPETTTIVDFDCAGVCSDYIEKYK